MSVLPPASHSAPTVILLTRFDCWQLQGVASLVLYHNALICTTPVLSRFTILGEETEDCRGDALRPSPGRPQGIAPTVFSQGVGVICGTAPLCSGTPV